MKACVFFQMVYGTERQCSKTRNTVFKSSHPVVWKYKLDTGIPSNTTLSYIQGEHKNTP
jgi:hypothetical protein